MADQAEALPRLRALSILAKFPKRPRVQVPARHHQLVHGQGPTRGLEIGDPQEVDWLRELEPKASISFLPRAWRAETWVLPGIWEDPVDGPVESICGDRRRTGGAACDGGSSPSGWHAAAGLQPRRTRSAVLLLVLLRLVARLHGPAE